MDRQAARTIQLIVEGDQWNSLPYIAVDDLRLALEQLICTETDDVRHVAGDVVNTLGAQGFLDLRDLLGMRRCGNSKGFRDAGSGGIRTGHLIPSVRGRAARGLWHRGSRSHMCSDPPS
jgi:hypothetical protein